MGQIIGPNITSAGYLATARFAGKKGSIFLGTQPKTNRLTSKGAKVPRKIPEKMETFRKTDGLRR
jgi:hypothetical protein